MALGQRPNSQRRSGRHRRLDFDFPEYRSSPSPNISYSIGEIARTSFYWPCLSCRPLTVFSLPTCISVIVVADSMTFFWVWRFAKFQPPNYASEYFEAGVISLVYALTGLLVWLLVNQLRSDQRKLADNLGELERTRERLMVEEKLAVVGRLSSAVAHEIRNPVSIIASSLVTAERPEVGEQQRREMLAIARSEAARLEKLTSDFLSYARPSQPKRNPTAMTEVLGYIAEIVSVHASKKDIRVSVESERGLAGER